MTRNYQPGFFQKHRMVKPEDEQIQRDCRVKRDNDTDICHCPAQILCHSLA